MLRLKLGSLVFTKHKAEEVYQANAAKGFWDEPRTFEHCCVLIQGELHEAIEAERKGRFADLEVYVNKHRYEVTQDTKSDFEKYCKDTVQDELADAAIRVLDTMGGFGILSLETLPYPFRNAPLIDVCDGMFSRYYNNRNNRELALGAFTFIEKYCARKGFGLSDHIYLKLQYNALRPYKHGKKY